MSTAELTHDVFVLERMFPKPPERVFRAFSDPDQKRRWYAEHSGSELLEYRTDFREGGAETAESRLQAGPVKGKIIRAVNTYLHIVTDAAVVQSQTMYLGSHRMSAALLTFAFNGNKDGGTRLVFTHQAVFFAGADGPAMRREGWEKLFDRFGELLP